MEAERNVRPGIVHVVALNAFVHDAEAAANNRLAAAGQVIGEAEARTEVGPVIVHQTLGYAVLLGDADAVQVQRNASENRVRAGAESGLCGTDRCRRDSRTAAVFGRVVEHG